MEHLRISEGGNRPRWKMRAVLQSALQLVASTLFCVSLTLAAQPASAKSYAIRSIKVEFAAKDEWVIKDSFTGNEYIHIVDPAKFGLTERRVIRELEGILSSVLIDATKDRRVSVDAKVVITTFSLGDEIVRHCRLVSDECDEYLEPSSIACRVYLMDSETGELMKKVSVVSNVVRSATIPRAYKQLLTEIAKTAQRKLTR